jgi:hypothetical protein
VYHTKEDQEEIEKILTTLDPDEDVEVVAKQSRLKPGGAKTSPDTIFVTDRRLIIRNLDRPYIDPKSRFLLHHRNRTFNTFYHSRIKQEKIL